ncbi:MAG: hypothetical protein H7070_09170 [Saprospiraceae bacterium]|nr:hypothetical protein [Pyrinomonadaceae bacterium]
MPEQHNEPETAQPDAHEPDEFSDLTDEELVEEARRQRAIVAQMICDKADIDPQILFDMDAMIERFEHDVAAEKQAHENLRQSTEALNKSAAALLANPHTNKMKPILAHPKAVQKSKGN